MRPPTDEGLPPRRGLLRIKLFPPRGHPWEGLCPSAPGPQPPASAGSVSSPRCARRPPTTSSSSRTSRTGCARWCRSTAPRGSPPTRRRSSRPARCASRTSSRATASPTGNASAWSRTPSSTATSPAARSASATLYDATDGQPGRSARYREFLAPQGYGDELRAAFRVGDSTWGVLDLYRDRAREAFSVRRDRHGALDRARGRDRAAQRSPTPAEPGTAGPATAPAPRCSTANGTLLSLDDQAERSSRRSAVPSGPRRRCR